MSVSIFILLIITSSAIIAAGRLLNNPNSDPLIPSFLLPIIADNRDLISSSFNGQNQLLHIMEHIIKYVSTIKSSEDFIADIINRENQVVNKLKILKFLKNCFEIVNTLIQHEINRLLDVSNTNKKSLFSISFTLKELQEAQRKMNGLRQIIERQIDILKTWIPPTMPFLNF